MKQKIIIDLEFNGLPRWGFTPEITQLKMINITNGKQYCKNFKTKKKGYIRPFYGEIEGKTYFKASNFTAALKKICNNNNGIDFYGFSIKTDKQVLKSYGIDLYYTGDIQEKLMLNQKFEQEMACGGRSLEACYYIATGKIIKEDTHTSIDELKLIQELYQIAYSNETNIFLTMYPYGDLGGMPLDLYVEEYRRRADGYRYNNNDLLAKSLNYYCDIADRKYLEGDIESYNYWNNDSILVEEELEDHPVNYSKTIDALARALAEAKL